MSMFTSNTELEIAFTFDLVTKIQAIIGPLFLGLWGHSLLLLDNRERVQISVWLEP